PIRVNPLPPAEARELLARRVGTERIRAEPEAVDAIVDRCAHLPLALSVVAARAAARPDRALAALAAEADGSGGRPETIGGPGSSTSVRAAFSPSYDALDDETARLFRLLGLHPRPVFSVDAAAALAGLPPARAEAAVASLWEAHLVTDHAQGRFGLPALLHAYAADLVRDEPEER